LAVLAETRNRNLLDIKREQQRIELTKSLADITGLVAIRQNRAGNFNFGQVMPDIREGDTLQPGMPVADILDLSEVEVWTKVGELDRANLREGQDALLQLDSIPDKQFHGKIKTLSGTATADVFSGDPAKKFDVVFSVDMRGLLAGLGMKPAEVDHIMATAEANSRKSFTNTAGSMFGSLQMTPNGLAGAGAGGQDQGAADNQDSGGRRGGGMPAGSMPVNGGRGASGGAPSVAGRGPDAGGRGPASGVPGGPGRGPDAGGRGPTTGMPGGPGRGAEAGGGTPPGGRGRSAADLMAMMANGGSSFTEQERANAKLPLPPGQDSQVQVLLRPGLLADVEIVVEKLPNVIHVPGQAVFEKGGKPIVYVQQKNGRFEAREVQLVKQSESMMVLGGGVEPGEIVALGDPTAGKNTQKQEKKASSDPMSSMPGGK
jgi:hypothetical protein